MEENYEIPATTEEAAALVEGYQNPTPEAEAAPAAAPATTEYGLNFKGKEEKYPIEKILEFAQQGRAFAQHMGDYNKRLASEVEKALAAERQKWAPIEEKFKRYDAVDQYIQKDPAWWEHVQKSYQERASGQVPHGTNAPPDPRYQQLEETVGKIVSTLEQREQAQLAEKEDLALNEQVTTFREKHKDLDWQSVDENGMDLEKRILDHAIKNGLTKPEQFSLAANDYLKDELIKRAAESAKGQVGKHIEKVTKLGLGPVTEQPTLKMKRAENVRSKSWDELTQEAIASAGIQ